MAFKRILAKDAASVLGVSVDEIELATLTTAELDAYNERLAHCEIDGGVSPERAREIALAQVRPQKSMFEKGRR